MVRNAGAPPTPPGPPQTWSLPPSRPSSLPRPHEHGEVSTWRLLVPRFQGLYLLPVPQGNGQRTSSFALFPTARLGWLHF